MEKLPLGERPEPRVVGNISDEERQVLVAEFLRVFREQPLQKAKKDAVGDVKKRFQQVGMEWSGEIGSLELEKTEKDLALISFVDEKVNEVVARYGGKQFSVPAKNFHFVSPEVMRIITNDDSASYLSDDQAIFVNVSGRKNQYALALSLAHELLHMKGVQVVEREISEEGVKSLKPEIRRMGAGAHSSERLWEEKRIGHTHFKGVEEGLTAELEKRIAADISRSALFDKERGKIEGEAFLALREKISKKLKKPPEEIYWAANEDKYRAFTYYGQREVINYVAGEIAKEDPEHFPDPESAFRLFTDMKFNGNMIPVRRVMARVFDEDAFEVLGMMTDDVRSASMTMEFLRRVRARKKMRERLAQEK